MQDGMPGHKPGDAVPLVKVDYDMCDWLNKAGQHIEKKQYSRAIEILQALIEKPDAGFVKVGPNRYVSLQSRVVELLGKMPDEGLVKYRWLYDPKARRKYDDAVRSGRVDGLREVVEFYRHTSTGPMATERLAAIQFDRGQFLPAVRYWKRLGPLSGDAEAVRLAKMAAAYHLGGDDLNAGKLAEQIRAKYPNTTATLGGGKQRITEFLTAVMAMPAMAAAKGYTVEKSYPGWGGVPDGLVKMDDCNVVLVPRWRYPPAPVSQENLYNKLVVRTVFSTLQASKAYLKDGHIHLQQVPSRGTRDSRKYSVPAILQPIVAGDQVIFRDERHVHAVDMYTGKMRWQSREMPLVRKYSATRYSPYGRWNGPLIDRGRYSLTLGGGKIFTIYNFREYPVRSHVTPQSQGDRSSSLAAMSLAAEGKQLWEIGNGKGSDEFLKRCTYVSLPTYTPPSSGRSGRLFVMAYYVEIYYLLCLNADTGELIWKSQIAQAPPLAVQHRWISFGEQCRMVGTPPAVSDGRVFVANNMGILAAFDTLFGQPLWVYQYKSNIPSNRMVFRRGGGDIRQSRLNPIIVTHGRVIALPSDSKEVLTLSVADGSSAWPKSVSRGSHGNLTAIDADRILLSGGGLRVLSARTGQELWKTQDIKAHQGRPVVTEKAILAVGKNTIHRISLDDYKVENFGLSDSTGLLGNLVCVDGKLIAANAMGLCGYFGYEEAYDVLTNRLKGETSDQKINILFQRAHLAFTAGKMDDALKDYFACRKMVSEFTDLSKARSIQTMLHTRLYRVYVAMGNAAETPEQMLAMFEKARQYAVTPQEKALMLIRLAKYYEKVGKFVQAVELATQIGGDYGKEQLVDVRIGSEADRLVRLSADRKTISGWDWSYHADRGFVKKLIELHGQEIYEKFNAQAKAALDEAIARQDPEAIQAVQNRWPLSKWADDAQFAAAEAYYLEVRQTTGPEADQCMADATRLLSAVASRPNSPHRVSATVALVAIYTAAKWKQAAAITRSEIASVPDDTQVAFADIRGKVADVLKAIDQGKITVRKTDVTPHRPDNSLQGKMK